MAKSYDAGKVVDASGWICLHRNENHFIGSDWMDYALGGDRSIKYTSYPDPFSAELRDRLAKLYDVSVSNIYVGNGSDGVLADIFALLRQTHSEINLPQVGYKVYDILASRLNFDVSRYVSGLNRADINSFSGLSVIDSPNAITGSTVTADLIDEISATAGNFVIWDNCYGDFESKQLNVAGKLSNMAVVRSFSKYYGLAGLRIGYCIASAEMVSALDRSKDVYNVNVVAQSLAARALDGTNEFEAFSARMLRVRNDLQKHLVALGFHVVEPHGNFIFASHPAVSGADFQARLESYQILVRRFDYPEISNWLRITVPAEADLDRVCEAFQAACTIANCLQLSAGE